MSAAGSLIERYRAKTPASAALAARAARLFPGGVTHDARFLEPYGVYVSHARGAEKWDADGNNYADYTGGHGALILGHGHAGVAARIREVLERGVHFGANHAFEVQWGALVQGLMPSLERIRFTASGTEAIMLAVRLARGFTGRPKLVRIAGHFNGWSDQALGGRLRGDNAATPAGILAASSEATILVPPNDVDALESALGGCDVAALILEPTGASFGKVPLNRDYMSAARSLTGATGALLIFDEVITGFRVSPGGAEETIGVKPDLTALGKILGGGLPAGAVGGRAEVLALLDARLMRASTGGKLLHYGTFNASPLSAASGIATLELIANTDACERASANAALLQRHLNEMFEAEDVPWAAYGSHSGLHIFLNSARRSLVPTRFNASDFAAGELTATDATLVPRLRLALLLHGVDINGWPGGVTSICHDATIAGRTTEAFARAISDLRSEGDLLA